MGISLSHSPEKEKKCLSCIIRFGKLVKWEIIRVPIILMCIYITKLKIKMHL